MVKRSIKLPTGVPTVAVNAGHLGTNGAVLSVNGKVETRYFPSIRATATGDSLRGMEKAEVYREWVDWRGERFFFGEDVLVGSDSRDNISAHFGDNRYGSEHYAFLVDVMTHCLGIREGEVNLILFCPPGLYNKVSPQIIKAFSGENVSRAISFRGSAKPRTWEIASVQVYPEGFHLGSALMLDDTGEIVAEELMEGRVAFIDGGGGTMDIYEFIDGSLNAELLSDATRMNAGIIKNILNPALRKVREKGGDFEVCTLHDLDKVMRTGLTTGDYWLRLGKTALDTRPLFEALFARFRSYVVENIFDGVFRGLNGFDAFYLIGGIYYLMAKELAALYPGKSPSLKGYAHIQNVAPVDYDVVGAVRYERHHQRKAGAK